MPLTEKQRAFPRMILRVASRPDHAGVFILCQRRDRREDPYRGFVWVITREQIEDIVLAADEDIESAWIQAAAKSISSWTARQPYESLGEGHYAESRSYPPPPPLED
jgi:hypothetical protein